MLAFAKEAASSEQAEPKKGGDSTCTGDGDGNDDTTPSSPSPSTSSTTKAANDRRRRSLRFDFSVPGVTSISVDVHKFGLSHKGTSVLLLKGSAKVDGAALRQSAFVATSDWVGGLYVSPGVAGSRSGALLAAAWASMVFVGRVREPAFFPPPPGRGEKGRKRKQKGSMFFEQGEVGGWVGGGHCSAPAPSPAFFHVERLSQKGRRGFFA